MCWTFIKYYMKKYDEIIEVRSTNFNYELELKSYSVLGEDHIKLYTYLYNKHKLGTFYNENIL